jgi:hypothetical protein
MGMLVIQLAMCCPGHGRLSKEQEHVGEPSPRARSGCESSGTQPIDSNLIQITTDGKALSSSLERSESARS